MGNPPKEHKACLSKKSFAGTAWSGSLNEAIDSGERAFFCHYNCNCILLLFWAARPRLLLCTHSSKPSTHNLANKTLQGRSSAWQARQHTSPAAHHPACNHKKTPPAWEPHTFVSLPPRANSYNVPFFLPQAFTLGPTQGKSAPVTLFFGVSVKVAIMTYKGRFGMFFNIGSALPTEANQASYP